ncbi:hypothetical protein I316_05046 [Kwoniella heveanensis BCC8398]|uniref:Kinase n=1 Tax=Kwoniella heveanensis BCC8398 TaxID=1296120 RepID=A0A1B9GR13_9TREE|nr:hypothetical protein I316_05046 [Kwoniella heveanensis BCC8398]
MAIEPGLEVYDSDYESADQQQNRPRSRSLSSVGSRSSGRSASTAATDYSDDEDVMMGPENWRETYGFQEPADLDTLGGHQGSFMTNEDGSLACKRAGKGEMEFYGRVAAGDPPFKHLGSVIPVYHGTVEHPSTKDSSSLSPTKKLGTVSDVELGIKPLARGNTVDEHEQSIILSNLLYGFRPETVTCADFKIGTSMHMSNADEQKVSEMEKQVDNTSSKHYGLRLVWGQTALESEDGAWSHVRSGKSYGRNIRKSPDDTEPWKDTLDDAIARFFPVPGETVVSREDKDMKRESELREAGTQVVHRDDPSTEASSRLAMRSGTWPKREDAVTVESQLQSLKKRKAAIEDMRDVIEDTKTQLSEISEAIRKTSCWKFTGSSVFLVHGVPEQWATGDDDLEGEMHLDWGVDSMGLPWDERDEWAVDRVAPEWNKPVLSPQGTRKGRTSYNGSLTGPGTSGSLAESSTVLSRPRRQVHVALIDHERGEWAVGPDEGALMGDDNEEYRNRDDDASTQAHEAFHCKWYPYIDVTNEQNTVLASPDNPKRHR